MNKTEAIVVGCVVLVDKHKDKHAFVFDRTPTKRGVVVTNFTTLTAQAHAFAQTMPFDAGEVLTVATSPHADPGAARLDPKPLVWGEYIVEREADE